MKQDTQINMNTKETGLVSKQELVQAFQNSINNDPQWNAQRPPLSYTAAKLLYHHFLLTVGNFVIDDKRSVRLDDIGILCLKHRKARSGIAPYSFSAGTNTAPTTYVSKPKYVMNLRRPFQFETDESED